MILNCMSPNQNNRGVTTYTKCDKKRVTDFKVLISICHFSALKKDFNLLIVICHKNREIYI